MLSNIISAIVNNFGEAFVPNAATPSVQFLFGAKHISDQLGANQIVVIPDEDLPFGPEVSFNQPNTNARELRRAWARVSWLIWGPSASIASWVRLTAEPSASLIIPTPAGQTTFYYSSSGGTTGSTEPTWPTVVGNTVVDGSVTWTCVDTVQNYEIHNTDNTEIIRNALVVAIHYAVVGAYRIAKSSWYAKSDLLVMYGQAYRLVVDFNTPWVDLTPSSATLTSLPLTAEVT